MGRRVWPLWRRWRKSGGDFPRDSLVAGETAVGFVDEGLRLQGVVFAFAPHGLGGEPFKFAVDDFEQAVFGDFVSLRDAAQQLRDFGRFHSDRGFDLEPITAVAY